MIDDLQPPDATQVSRIDYDNQLGRDSLNPDAVRSHVDSLQELHTSMRYSAVITAVSDSYSDEYTIDLYGAGYGVAATHTGFTAYPSDPQTTYAVNNRVKVRYLPNGTMIILPVEIPQVTGFGLIYMIVDDATPGTQTFDYGRFTTPSSPQSF